jgi:hypothetical protein
MRYCHIDLPVFALEVQLLSSISLYFFTIAVRSNRVPRYWGRKRGYYTSLEEIWEGGALVE